LTDKTLYEFDRFRFDPADRLLLEEGRPVPLTPKALEILFVLVQNGNRLTTKEELMRKVWPDSFVEEANLTVNISALRKILGETADGRQYIETVPKSGYRFVVPVKESRDEALSKPIETSLAVSKVAEPIVEESAADLGSKTTETRRIAPEYRPRYWVLFAFALLLVVAVPSYIVYRGQTVRRQTEALKQPRRLAILPFQNLRGDPGDDFLGFSLADAVITKLGYVSALIVRPSYAVQKYKSQPTDPSKIATDLDVDTLLTGTFLHEGDDLRIACQLVDVKTQNILWKGTFDLKYEKLLTVQDNVARQVISGLELTLSPSEAARLKPDQPINPTAYEYYLRGVDLYSKGDFPVAIQMLKKSTEIAPNYALTWANLGRSYTANASFQFGGGKQYLEAQTSFEHALALQPGQIDARIYMANMLTDTGQVEKAVPLLRDALRANPNQAETHWELGYAYRFAGMLQQSVSECERARQLDPVVKLTSSALNSYLYLGQYDRFLESLPKTDDVALIVFYRGFGEYHKKEWDRAAKDFDLAFELNPSLLHAQIGKALSLGVGHQESKGVAILGALEVRITRLGVGDPEAAYKIAEAYATLGDKSSALRVLRYSIEKGFFSYPYFVADPLLESLRHEDEFSKLMTLALKRHSAFKLAFF
jgi:DNA-binding winged helix-turn-helix (wHTH) protein/TolB-like protein/tetratricopeptide (TPR) repeat protein